MKSVRYEWDEAKRERNLAKHGIDFTAAERFDWVGALDYSDRRRNYGEGRRLAYGLVDGRLHALAYVPRGDACRIISFRKANRREQAAYAAATARRRG